MDDKAAGKMPRKFQSPEQSENIYSIAERLKLPERKIIDFSTPTNFLGVSKKVKAEIRKHLKYLHNYPDPEAKRLRKRLSQYHEINPEMILCGHSISELLCLIVKTLRPQKILFIAPTNSELESVVRGSEFKEKKIQIDYVELQAEHDFYLNPDDLIRFIHSAKNSSEIKSAPSQAYDIVILSNPNNLTGRVIKKDDINRIANTMKELNCYLIVDESFIDFCPDDSLIAEVENNQYLVVLRTMSYFYSLAGIGYGYGVFPRNIIDDFKSNKDPLTVNSLAQRAGVVALKDKVYRKETFSLLRKEKYYLEKSFKKLGLHFFPSDTNFYLLRTSSALDIFSHMSMKGMLVGYSDDFKGPEGDYIRIAVKSHRENTLLIKELSYILKT